MLNPPAEFVCLVPPGLLPLSVKELVVPALAFHCHATLFVVPALVEFEALGAPTLKPSVSNETISLPAAAVVTLH